MIDRLIIDWLIDAGNGKAFVGQMQQIADGIAIPMATTITTVLAVLAVPTILAAPTALAVPAVLAEPTSLTMRGRSPT